MNDPAGARETDVKTQTVAYHALMTAINQNAVLKEKTEEVANSIRVWSRTLRDVQVKTGVEMLSDDVLARYSEYRVMRLLDSLAVVPESIKDAGYTQPPQCMPEQYRRDCSVRAYRAYYNGEKAHFAQWNHSDTPEWWTGVPNDERPSVGPRKGPVV